jgi:hypothetical protein
VGVAATLLAACSGGSNSVLTTGANAASTPQSLVSVSLDTSRLTTSQVRNGRRGAQFVGALDVASGNLNFAFTGGANPTGTIPLSGCAPSGNTGMGVTYTCTIVAAAATYSGLTLSLSQGSTTVANGSYVGAPFTLVSGPPPAAITVVMAPVLAGPALSIINGQAIAWYMENHIQSISLAANEVDPIGNVITTYYGPVSNWLPLTLTLGGSSAGVTFVGGATTIPAAPSAAAGSTEVIEFNGTSSNLSTMTLTLSDNVNPNATVSVPYVSMTTTLGAINVTGGNVNVTVTEMTTSGTVPDANFVSSSNCGANIAVLPGLGLNAITASGTTGAVTYSVQHSGGASGSCTLTVASYNDSNLNEQIAVTY